MALKIENSIPLNQSNSSKKQKTEDAKDSFFLLAYNRYIYLMIAAVLALIIKHNFISIFSIPSASMEPTIMTSDSVIGSPVLSRQTELKRGDIIVFWHTDENGIRKRLIKRIIGLPGDEIVISSGNLYINEELMTEEYVLEDWSSWTDPSGNSLMSVTVGDNEYFCLGDNRLNSQDSRYFGNVDKENIITKVYIASSSITSYRKLE